MSAPAEPDRGATANSHPDGTGLPDAGQGRERARAVAERLRDDDGHPITVAARRANARCAAAAVLAAWRARRAVPEPPPWLDEPGELAP